jgi:exopolysaccharide biosynthesis polyprenyl glycosylphosphotransferase
MEDYRTDRLLFPNHHSKKLEGAATLELPEKYVSSAYQWKIYIVLLILVDALMTLAAFRLAYFLRFELHLSLFKLEIVPSISLYFSLVTVLTPLWIVILAVAGLYNRQNLLGGTQEYSLVFTSTTIGIVLVITAGFVGTAFVIARGWLLSAWLCTFILVSLGRFILRRMVYTLRRKGYFLSPTVIVGVNPEAHHLAEQLIDWEHSGFFIHGFVDNELITNGTVYHDLPVLGTLAQLDEIIKTRHVEEIIVVTSAISRDMLLSIFKRYGMSNGINVRLSSGLYELVTTGVQVKEFASVPLLKINKVRLTGIDEVLKAIIDYGLTIPALIILAPLMAAIAIAVKLDSKGPVIYRRKVMGVNGKTFDAYKFRTMAVDGDDIFNTHPELKAEWQHTQKLKVDPRITHLGGYLRKLSMDELPQLFNVLKHEMSLVGPRMIAPVEMENYAHWGTNLLTIRPGISGLWQVSGRSDISYEERVRMDMYYIRNWTFWLDIVILLRTIPAAIKGKGAY